MEIKIDWVEVKQTKFGKPMKRVTVTHEGKQIDVNIFSNFPDFANIAPGSVIMGQIKQDGKYWNIEPDGVATTRGGAYTKPNIVENQLKVQKEISKNVEKAADNKDHSVRISSTMRDAVAIAIAEGEPNFERILSLRKWLWKHWDDPDTDALYPD